MYTGLDVLFIVLMVIFATAVITVVCFSCAIANGTEKDKEEAYRHGYADGKKQVERMTEQEAINEFKERLAIPCYKESIPKYYEAMEMAVKALEKQIEKKPIKDKEFSSLFDCPSCGRRQKIMYEQNYCKVCGQKLDWGNEDAE